MRSKRKRSFKQNYSFIYILTYFLALIALIYVCEHASLFCLSKYIYIYIQWRSQDFGSEGAKLKGNI